jgi:leucyl aminopeptidase
MLDIAFAKAALPKNGAVVVAMAEGAELAGLAAALDQALEGRLGQALKAAEFTGKKGQSVNLPGPGAGLQRLLVLGLGKQDKLDARAAEEFGGAVQAALVKEESAAILADGLDPPLAAHAALGARLRSYKFDKYRTTLKPDEKPKLSALKILVKDPAKATAAYVPLAAVWPRAWS